MAERLGSTTVVSLLACVQGDLRDLWWLTPWWPLHVREFVGILLERQGRPVGAVSDAAGARFRVARSLESVLLTAPDRLDLASAKHCLLAGLGHPHGRHPLVGLARAPYTAITRPMSADFPANLWPAARDRLAYLIGETR